ncbi:MAG: hypothetical protein KGO50_03380 [Myxococcales bacterium]|nr:hypothetical protein [Myxococcales bacterium]
MNAVLRVHSWVGALTRRESTKGWLSAIWALELFFVVRSASHITLMAHIALEQRMHTYEPWLAAAALCALFAFVVGWRSVAVVVAAACSVAMNIQEFPYTANHAYLQSYVLCLAAICRVASVDADDTPTPFIHYLRVSFAVLLFHTGWQKWVAGTYDRAEFIAQMFHSDKYRFGEFFGQLAPADIPRLAVMNPRVPNEGPFEYHSWLVLLASNSAMYSELIFPVLVWLRRWGNVFVLVSLGFVWAFQFAATEISFALLATAIAMSFFSPRIMAPVLYLLMAIDVGVAFWIARNSDTWLN